MKTKRRILASIIAVCLCMATVAPVASATSGPSHTKTLVCTKTEHTHTESCYKTVSKLNCGQETIFGGDNESILGLSLTPDTSTFTGMFTPDVIGEHTHTQICMQYTEVLSCNLEEHTHTVACYQNAGVSDIFGNTDDVFDQNILENAGSGETADSSNGDAVTGLDADIWSSIISPDDDGEEVGPQIEAGDENSESVDKEEASGSVGDSEAIGGSEDSDLNEDVDSSEGGDLQEDIDGSEENNGEAGGDEGDEVVGDGEGGKEEAGDSGSAEEKIPFDEEFISDYTNWMKYYDTDDDGQITFTVTYVLNKAIPMLRSSRASLADLEVIQYRPEYKDAGSSWYIPENIENKDEDSIWQLFIPGSIDPSLPSMYLYEETKDLTPNGDVDSLYEAGCRSIFGKFINVDTGDQIYEGYESAYYALSRETFVLKPGMTVEDILLPRISYKLAYVDAELEFTESPGFLEMLEMLELSGNDPQSENVAEVLRTFTDVQFTSLRDNVISPSDKLGETVQHGVPLNRDFRDVEEYIHTSTAISRDPYLFWIRTNVNGWQYPKLGYDRIEQCQSFTDLIAGIRVAGVCDGERVTSSQVVTVDETRLRALRDIELAVTKNIAGTDVTIPSVCDGTNIYLVFSEDNQSQSIEDSIVSLDARFMDMEDGEHFTYRGADGDIVEYPVGIVGAGEGYIAEAYDRGRGDAYANLGNYGWGIRGFDNSHGVSTGLFPTWNFETGSPNTVYGNSLILDSTSELLPENIVLPLEFIKSGDNYTLIGSGLSEDNFASLMEMNGMSSENLAYDKHTGSRHGARVSEGGKWVGGLSTVYSAYDMITQSDYSTATRSKTAYLEMQYTSLYTNYFWPLPYDINGYFDQYKVEAYDSYYGYSAEKLNYMGFSNTDALHDVKHNEYYTMVFDFEFTVPRGYVGPLDYFFFGDDDMIVYLDGKCVVDLGGIHRSAGAYINLWEALPELRASNTMMFNNGTSKVSSESQLPENNHTLTIFYVERGGSGSTCYIDMTLPNLVLASQDNSGKDIIVTKDVVSDVSTADDEEFTFKCAVSADLNTVSELQWDALLGITADIFDDAGYKIDTVNLSYNNDVFTLKDGWEAHLRDVPYNYYVRVVEEGYPTYFTSNVTIYEGELPVNNGHKDIYQVSADSIAKISFAFVNTDTRVAVLPRTGGPGTAIAYAVGLGCVFTGLLALRCRRKEL